jgi:parvulin-like peptidyl-prolyl isomerase
MTPRRLPKSGPLTATAAAWTKPLIKQLLREPLLHFVVLGALLFLGYRSWPPPASAEVPSKQIQFTVEQLTQLALQFQSQWRRPPTADELDRLVENRVQSEILYREALALRLDKDDEIVRRRMAQKMQFLAEDIAAAHEPDSAELRKWFEANRSRFAEPSRVSFRHVYFSPDKRAHAQEDATRALAKLADAPQDSTLPGTLADPFMFQDYYRDRAPEYLSKEFGPRFAMAITQLVPGRWTGPVESGFGWHLVYVDTLIPGRVPAFEEVEEEVKVAWLTEQKATAWRRTYEDMRAKYVVLLPAAPREATVSKP